MPGTLDLHLWSERLFYELALFATGGYLLIGINELVIDLIWLIMAVTAALLGGERFGWYRLDRLPRGQDEARFGVLVPAYRESAVIGQMLSNALKTYAGRNVHIFVGCYSCDPETMNAVRPFCGARLSMTILLREGGTTKADCLNSVWRAALAQELHSGKRFDAVILHDAEDVVDGDEIAVFSAFIDRYAMIQLPVIPLRHPSSRWISGHYCDEFAEAHGKVMMVRQAIGAALPSAGVGCMIRRDAMERLAGRDCGPFDEMSSTEDYELGLRLRGLGFSTAFLRVRSPNRFGVVATSGYFPAGFDKAVAQKTRWVSGISLSGWNRLRWGRGIAENWMRLRDRIAVLAALVSVTGYAAALLGLAMLGFGWSGLARPLTIDPRIAGLIWITGHLLVWRLAVRAHFVSNHYSIVDTLLSIPRIAISSAIAICSGQKAVPKHLREMRRGKVSWEKTDHLFPGALP